MIAAINQSNLSRTAADMRAIGTAVGSYQVDYNYFPVHTGEWNNDLVNNGSGWTYYEGVGQDAWGTPFHYTCKDGMWYTLLSYGKDKVPGWSNSEYDSDIIFFTGQFTAPQRLSR